MTRDAPDFEPEAPAATRAARLVTRSALLALALVAAASCRDPYVEPAADIPDAGEFDAGGEDDAGPGELCPAGSPDLFNDAYSHYIGGEDSVDLVVSNFSYFRCPHCAHFAEMSDEIWAARPEFRSRVRLYYHHYPFDNTTSWQLHAAAEAAGRQGMENFWAVHDLLYGGMNAEPQHLYSVEEVIEFVDQELDLDMEQFHADRQSDEVLAFLAWDKSQAQAAGVTGTPSVFICGEKISWSSIEDIVDGYLSE